MSNVPKSETFVFHRSASLMSVYRSWQNVRVNMWRSATYERDAVSKCHYIVVIVFVLVYHIHMSATAPPERYYPYDQLQICSAYLILTLLNLARSYWTLNFNPSRWDFDRKNLFFTPLWKIILIHWVNNLTWDRAPLPKIWPRGTCSSNLIQRNASLGRPRAFNDWRLTRLA